MIPRRGRRRALRPGAVQHAATLARVPGVTSARETADRARFDAFVRTDGPGLLRFATLLTGSRTDAEDLVQAALTQTYARWGRLRLDDPGAYVRRAIVNARTSGWRRTRRTVTVAEPPDRAAPDAYAAVDDRSALTVALASLSRPQRVVLLLRHLDGWDYPAIADALSLPQATVRSHHARGLARLRAALTPDLLPADLPHEGASR